MPTLAHLQVWPCCAIHALPPSQSSHQGMAGQGWFWEHRCWSCPDPHLRPGISWKPPQVASCWHGSQESLEGQSMAGKLTFFLTSHGYAGSSRHCTTSLASCVPAGDKIGPLMCAKNKHCSMLLQMCHSIQKCHNVSDNVPYTSLCNHVYWVKMHSSASC